MSNFIGSGSFGCAFTPPIPCECCIPNDMKKRKLIGKVFFDSKDIHEELDTYQKIVKYDPKNKLFPKMFPYQTCSLDKKLHAKELKKCNLGGMQFNDTQRFQIVQEYAGNQISEIISKYRSRRKKPNLNFFLKSFETLGRQLLKFNKHLFHNDIHEDNVVMDDEYNMKLIDIGMVQEKPKLPNEDNIMKFTYPYDYYVANKLISREEYENAYIFQIEERNISNIDLSEMFELAKKDISKWDLQIKNHNLFDSFSLGLVFFEFMNELYPKWTTENLMKIYPILNPNPLKRRQIGNVLKKIYVVSE